MDRNFHTDDFERLLREKSDEFRMYPSRRIWYSIYNNIHPGKKWPSVAMSITLITALFLIGYLNTKNAGLYSQSGKIVTPQQTVAQVKPIRFMPITLNDYPAKPHGTAALIVTGVKPLIVPNNDLPENNVNKAAIFSFLDIMPAASRLSGDIQRPHNSGTPLITEKNEVFNPSPAASGLSSLPEANEKEKAAYTIDPAPADNQYIAWSNPQKNTVSTFLNDLTSNDDNKTDLNKPVVIQIKAGNIALENNLREAAARKAFISQDDKDWIENYALYNRPASKRWANKLFWQIYATPSVVYRTLSEHKLNSTALNAPLIPVVTNQEDINQAVNQRPSYGFEAGSGIQYALFKGIKIKAGVQLNYTRYNAEAFQNTHPFVTTVIMNDYPSNTSYTINRTTPYSNKSGLDAVRLHNETLQISLPVGADIKLMGNENLQWNVGFTIQPTYIPAGRSYLISSDRRNYVKETSMINRWNMNAGFETFISYQSHGMTWQIGPQFRSQLFSTNSKQIAVQEKLGNYGIKFGVFKTIK